jgi:UDP-2,3-diacylglucosamine hydrolase
MVGQAYTLLISDLHLHATRPHTTRLLLDFLATTARGAQALYVLGDLFEYWLGDDDLADPHHQSVADALRALSQSGTAVYLMHGNRDLLLGREFCERSGAILLQDPYEANLHGWRVLLSHADALCTDDLAYQQFRRKVRNPLCQGFFLILPMNLRRTIVRGFRRQSETEKSAKPAYIMDVNPQAVAELLRSYNYPDLFIHGHTHRPAEHSIELDGHHCARWVLGDWGARGDYLRLDADGCSRHTVFGAET